MGLISKGLSAVIDQIIKLWPVLIVLVLYFVRLEGRLAKICTDLSWIKKYIHACQRN